jgi:hypothetical protein
MGYLRLAQSLRRERQAARKVAKLRPDASAHKQVTKNAVNSPEL